MVYPVYPLEYVCNCVYICIYVYMYICIYVYMYICIYVYMYICTCLHICVYIYIQKYCVYTICINWCSIFSINNSRPISQLLNIRHFASLRRCASTISSTHATSGAASLSVRQTTTSRPGEETLWKQRFLCEDFWGDEIMSYSLDWRMAGWCGMPLWNGSPRAPLAHCRSKRNPTLRAPAGPTFLCSRTYSKGWKLWNLGTSWDMLLHCVCMCDVKTKWESPNQHHIEVRNITSHDFVACFKSFAITYELGSLSFFWI